MGTLGEYEPQDLLDMARAEGEGMVARDYGAENGRELETLLRKVESEFWRRSRAVDLEEVILEVVGEMNDREVEGLRVQLKQFLGEVEWNKLEKEETKRSMDFVFYRDLTPG